MKPESDERATRAPAPALERQLTAALEELRHARAEQKRLELMAKGFSGVLREQADAHLETLDRLQRREEEALRRSEERFQLLLESAGEGIYGIDDAGRISFVNPAAARMLGADPAVLFDQPLGAAVRHVHEEEAPCAGLACPLTAPLRTGVPAAGEVTLHASDGRAIPVEYTTTPIRQEGTVAGAVIVLRDVTERRRIEFQRERLLQDLQASVTARDDFLSIASHELRTPLTPVRYQVHMLKRALGRRQELDPEQLRQRIEGIESQLDRLERLIDQLLDVSRITVGRLELYREPVDFAALVRETAARMRPEITRSGSTLALEASSPVVGRWDPLRLEQVISNLLSNAVKYGAGKPVEVAVRRASGGGVLTVRDSGIGIAPEDQARIFDRFERLVSVRHYGGFGLGLWIVRTVVEAHGGTIAVDSAEGRGTTFTVALPIELDSTGGLPVSSGNGRNNAAGRL